MNMAYMTSYNFIFEKIAHVPIITKLVSYFKKIIKNKNNQQTNILFPKNVEKKGGMSQNYENH